MNTRYRLLLSFVALGFTANAQTADAAPAAATETAKPAMTKEEKAKQKAQQEQDLSDAFKAAGLTDAQVTAAREALDAANKESKELKANTALTDEQKAEAKQGINDRKNARLKEVMGADTFKKWSTIRKEQKARTAGQ